MKDIIYNRFVEAAKKAHAEGKLQYQIMLADNEQQAQLCSYRYKHGYCAIGAGLSDDFLAGIGSHKYWDVGALASYHSEVVPDDYRLKALQRMHDAVVMEIPSDPNGVPAVIKEFEDYLNAL
jgi:hypothetical protein